MTAPNGQQIISFDNSYARLPERFYARLPPTPVAAPRLVRLNEILALELDMVPERLASDDGVAVLSGNSVATGSEPIAMAYAGHQFGSFVPQLGDGRAILLGEVVDREGRRRDIQLKGAGPTPFSRRGDGRAALGPVLREYLVSEAMVTLGVPTTRALAALTTGETIYRETALPGAVLVRVASSHVRVGSFQYFAARRDAEALRALADYVVARNYPELQAASERYRALLNGVIERQAELVAKWLGIGFIHGVMNTDNMSIAGETIDYGPCAFMDTYHPATVFSSIDETGRYAFANQPSIAQWNLARFAETLLPLLSDDDDRAVQIAQDALGRFPELFNGAFLNEFARKLGIRRPRADDLPLIQDLLAQMAADGADFTLTFRHLGDSIADASAAAKLRAMFADAAKFENWHARWRARLGEENSDPLARNAQMRRSNPLYIPRNHLVEEAIAAAVNDSDFKPFETLNRVLSEPCEERSDWARFATPPRPDQVVHQTFCGT